MAFALAASVSDEVHSTPVTIGLYTGAALTGWSRINDDKHWLSDVAMGALRGNHQRQADEWPLAGLRHPRAEVPAGAGPSWGEPEVLRR